MIAVAVAAQLLQAPLPDARELYTLSSTGRSGARQARLLLRAPAVVSRSPEIAMESYLLDWANLLLRWLHVITAIAWVGSSFYFVFLDSSLAPPAG